MKKILAVILTVAVIFTFAACKNELANSEATTEASTEATTGTPGAWVTNAQGEVMTTAIVYVMPDENSQPMTEIVTDENGSRHAQLVTTVIYDVWTNPGATELATVPAGHTMANLDKAWPADEFMAKVPVLSDKVSDVSFSENDKGKLAIMYINDLSYADYLGYIEECKAAGFAQTKGNTQMPETEEDGKSYFYYSVANGLHLNIVYNTDSAPYRNCDVKIIVSTYDPLDV